MEPLKYLLAALILGTVAAAGCARDDAPRFDGSSPAAAESSVGKLLPSLSPVDRLRFETALEEIGAPYLELVADTSKLGDAWERELDQLEAEWRSALDGKTAAQIIRMAEPAVTRRIEAERRELAALSEKKDTAEAAQRELERFSVVRAELDLGAPARREPPYLDLVVLNETPFVVIEAQFHVELATPGRLLPWQEQEFWHHFAGGIEPGEQASLRAILQVGWRSTRADPAAVLTVRTRDIRAPGSVPRFPVFSASDERRLLMLRGRHQD